MARRPVLRGMRTGAASRDVSATKVSRIWAMAQAYARRRSAPRARPVRDPAGTTAELATSPTGTGAFACQAMPSGSEQQRRCGQRRARNGLWTERALCLTRELALGGPPCAVCVGALCSLDQRHPRPSDDSDIACRVDRHTSNDPS